jgi:hypothetical protein
VRAQAIDARDERRVDPATFGLRAHLFATPALIGTGGNPTLDAGSGGEVVATFTPSPLAACVDWDQLAFIDFAHPSAAIHAIWGAFSAASLVSETFFRGRRRRRRRGHGARRSDAPWRRR